MGCGVGSILNKFLPLHKIPSLPKELTLGPNDFDLVIHRITASSLAGDHLIQIRFGDNTEKLIDFEPFLYGPIFGHLRDLTFFVEVQLDPDFSALV